MMAVESGSVKSPSISTGILRNGLAARNCGSVLVVGLMGRVVELHALFRSHQQDLAHERRNTGTEQNHP